MSEIVQMSADGQPITTSEIIATNTKTEHASILKLVRGYASDFGEFGVVGFEIRPKPAGQIGGGPITFAVLNEQHAMLLMAYMKNSEIVRFFKKALVHAFKDMRDALASTPVVQETEQQTLARGLAIANRILEETKVYVKELEPVARSYTFMVVAAHGDYDMKDTATSLSSTPGITIGEGRLWKYLLESGWTYRDRSDGRWRAKQPVIERGWLKVTTPDPYWNEHVQEWRLSTPQVRTTEAGRHELRMRLSSEEGKLVSDI
jgi:phage regulator Rha-like protein